MCGIGGYIALGGVLPGRDTALAVFTSLRSRGRDAAGAASWSGGGGINIIKSPGTVDSLTKSEQFKSFEFGTRVLFHTRAATTGTARKNANNHPLIGRDFGLVHNGIITNHRELFEKNKWTRTAEVDSEVLVPFINMGPHNKTFKQLFAQVRGSWTFACLFKDGRTLLVRHDNPLYLYLDTNDVLWFASERTNLDGVVTYEEKYGFRTEAGHFVHMPDNSALLMGEQSVLFSKSYHYRARDNFDRGYYSRRTDYKSGTGWYYTEGGGTASSDDAGNRYSQYDNWRKSRHHHEVSKCESVVPLNNGRREVVVPDNFIRVSCPYCAEDTLFNRGILVNYCSHCGTQIEADDDDLPIITTLDKANSSTDIDTPATATN